MFINGLEASYLFSRHFRMVHEIIVQAMRGGTLAVAGRRGEVLCNPPRLVTEFAVETCNSCALSAAGVGFNSENVFAKPSQKLWINLGADVGSRRILGGSFKFPFVVGAMIRIEFENEALAVS